MNNLRFEMRPSGPIFYEEGEKDIERTEQKREKTERQRERERLRKRKMRKEGGRKSSKV